MRVDDPPRPLNPAERQRLVDALCEQGTMNFTKVRKLLGLDAAAYINFERGEKTSLDGHRTDAVLRAALKTRWQHLSEGERDRLVFLLAGDSTSDQLAAMLHAEFGLSNSEVEALGKVSLPPGRMMYSRSTIARLVPQLRTAENLRGAITAAGFPLPEEVRAAKKVEENDITNPLVRSTLQQLGKLLKALDARFQRPDGTAFDAIRIELSRDVSNSRKDRERITKDQRRNEVERRRAQVVIAEWAPGNENRGEYIRRVQLWEEQAQQCLYSGQPITAAKLFTNEVQVDHILPRSQTLDNGMSNVALVMGQLNLEKGDRTLTEWRGTLFAQQVAERATALKLRRKKIANLLEAHVPTDAIPQSLLASTGYINAVARDYVRQTIGIEAEVSKGRLTRAMLYRIGLEKDKTDHRRHALDAAMIALTTPSVANRLAKHYKAFRDGGVERPDDYGGWEPWKGCRAELEAHYKEIVVSHRARRKVSGQLHEETHYGKVVNPYHGRQLHARRKALTGGLTASEFKEVADPVVRQALVLNLIKRGLDPTAKKLVFDAADLPVMPDGQVVRRVRLHKNLPDNRVVRSRQPNTTLTMSRNHSAGVIRHTTTDKWRLQIMPTFDAFRNREVDERTRFTGLMNENEELLFTLTQGDLVELKGGDDVISIWKVTSFEADGRVQMFPSASVPDQALKERFVASTLCRLQARKIVVTPDGQVRRARD